MAKHSTFSRFAQIFALCTLALCSNAALAQKPSASALVGDYAGSAPPNAKLSDTERRYTAAHLRLQADGSYSLVEMFDKLPYRATGSWQVQNGQGRQGNTLTLTAAVSALPPSAKLERSLPTLPAIPGKNYADEAQVHSGGVGKLPAVSSRMSELKSKTGLIAVRVTDATSRYVYGNIRIKLTFSNDQTFTTKDIQQTVTDSLGLYYYQLAPGQQIKSISLGVSGVEEMGSPSLTCQLAGGRSGAVALGGDPQKSLGTFAANPAMSLFDFSFAPNRLDTPSEKVSVYTVQNGKLIPQAGSSSFNPSWVFSKGKSAVPACIS
jgi:hypothetical protein